MTKTILTVGYDARACAAYYSGQKSAKDLTHLWSAVSQPGRLLKAEEIIDSALQEIEKEILIDLSTLWNLDPAIKLPVFDQVNLLDIAEYRYDPQLRHEQHTVKTFPGPVEWKPVSMPPQRIPGWSFGVPGVIPLITDCLVRPKLDATVQRMVEDAKQAINSTSAVSTVPHPAKWSCGHHRVTGAKHCAVCAAFGRRTES